MPQITPTKQATDLRLALEKRGVVVKPEYWDGHKHVDLYVPEAKLYIEVDGLQHFTDPKQIIADLKRDHYSDGDDIFTKRFSNQLIETHLQEIADAIAQIKY
jgi:very-short-patch-repair endonuclease